MSDESESKPALPEKRKSGAPRRVCLLMGGETGERGISIASGIAVGEALLRLGNEVLFLDPATGRRALRRPGESVAGVADGWLETPPRPEAMLDHLHEVAATRPDLVAILLHGGAGEGGRIQAALELAGLAYTGSGPEASALAMDKVAAKVFFRDARIPVPAEALWRPAGRAGSGWAPGPIPDVGPLGGYPVVVKPIAGGSTLGLTIVREPSLWPAAWEAAHGEIDPRRGLLVEQFIPGRELTVGVLDDQPLPVVEIIPRTGFYDFQHKYTKGQSDYIVPAQIPSGLAAELQERSVRAWHALGCRGMARVDYRLDPSGEAWCLEINTIPGMTATSLLPMAAGAVGVGFDALVERICRATAMT